MSDATRSPIRMWIGLSGVLLMVLGVPLAGAEEAAPPADAASSVTDSMLVVPGTLVGVIPEGIDQIEAVIVSRDGSRAALHARGASQSFVVLVTARASVKDELFDRLSTPVLSADGLMLAYLAHRAIREIPAGLSPGATSLGRSFADIRAPLFGSKESMAPEAEARSQAFLIVGMADSEAGRMRWWIVSPEGTAASYRAQRSRQGPPKEFLSLADQWLGATERMEFLGRPVISPDSRRIAWQARRGDRVFVIVGDLATRRFIKGDDVHWVGELAFSPDSRHLAYTAGLAGRAVAIVDGQVSPGFDSIDSALLFDPEHDEVAFGARLGDELRWYVMDMP